ncbi:hypothetical protein FOMPIDRAFT_116019 [Fomitopsis schrenkii]|uniref:Uncharacterized protein n=1 Tax=Fomitopsis schrenkii TaxID=2126942 RepID=S8F0N6_FOMSC|nr:hypothetical protein FOMPIDRAFT_116019 [Fomitopsis schrenkii]
MNMGFLSRKANAGQTPKLAANEGSIPSFSVGTYALSRCEDVKSAAAIIKEGSIAIMEEDILRAGATITGGHHRTPSSSTASSSSISTRRVEDWWDERSPWAWQWVESAVECNLE